ncbi:MAG: ABC transporter permease, partial [Moorea sp. SIO3C2]|nr:ABC transporter permease [Moorena sp. SIO3C2]
MTTESAQSRSFLKTLLTIATSDTTLYVIKRILQALLTLLLASAFSFFIIQLAPGDFLDAQRQNPQISPETLAQFERQFGLDQPIWKQYFLWLKQVVTRLNFGESFAYQRPAVEVLAERIPNTLLLSISSIIVTWAIAIPLGIIGAVNHNKFADRSLRVLSYIGQGFPALITGLLLLFFAQLTAPLFPVGGRTSINHDDLNWIGK